MCPVCLVNMGFITAGVASTTGLAALAVKTVLLKLQAKLSNKRNSRRTSEDRNNGTENGREGRESI